MTEEKSKKIPLNAYYEQGMEALQSLNKLNMEICHGMTKIQTAFMQQAMDDFQNLANNPTAGPQSLMEVTKNNMQNYTTYLQRVNEVIHGSSKDFNNIMKDTYSKMKPGRD